MAGLSWVKYYSHMVFPPSAVKGGTDKDGSTIYVGRASFQGDVLPAKVIPQRRAAYVCYNGNEELVGNYEILCQGILTWVPSSRGNVPAGAVPVGTTRNNETLYAGRVWHDGAQTVGKVHCSHGKCYIPYNGREIPFSAYEVLCLK